MHVVRCLRVYECLTHIIFDVFSYIVYSDSHIFIYTYIYVYVYIMYIFIYVCICASIYKYIRIHICICTMPSEHICAHPNTVSHMRVHLHTVLYDLCIAWPTHTTCPLVSIACTCIALWLPSDRNNITSLFPVGNSHIALRYHWNSLHVRHIMQPTSVAVLDSSATGSTLITQSNLERPQMKRQRLCSWSQAVHCIAQESDESQWHIGDTDNPWCTVGTCEAKKPMKQSTYSATVCMRHSCYTVTTNRDASCRQSNFHPNHVAT